MQKHTITTEGVISAICFFFLLLLGIVLNHSVFLLSSILGYIIITAAFFLGRCNISNLNISIDGPECVYAKQKFNLRFTSLFTNKFLPHHCIKYKYSILNNQSITFSHIFSKTNKKNSHKEPLAIPQRGYTPTIDANISSTFPLGLFKHKKTLQIDYSLTVYPERITPLEMQSNGSHQNDAKDLANHHQITEGEMRGIREWMPGDPMKHISWKTSVLSLERGRQLCIREFEPYSLFAKSSAIIFHSYAEKGELLHDDAFDFALNLTTGTLSYLRNMGISPQLYADFHNFQAISSHSTPEYNEALTLLSKAQRVKYTDEQNIIALQAKIDQLSHSVDQLIIISDSPPTKCCDNLDLPKDAFIIDILQQHKSIHNPQALKHAV